MICRYVNVRSLFYGSFIVMLLLVASCRKAERKWDHYKASEVDSVFVDKGRIKITLNRGTELWVPVPFDDSVIIKGEAFIQIDSASSVLRNPLFINAGGIPLKCKYGAFDVSVFKVLKEFYVGEFDYVNEGWLSVVSGAVTCKSTTVRNVVVDIEDLGVIYHWYTPPVELTAWIHGEYHFSVIDLYNFLRMVRPWYGINSLYFDPSSLIVLKDFRWKPSESLSDLIKRMERNHSILLSYDKEKKFISVAKKY